MSWQHDLPVTGAEHPLWMRIAAGRLQVDVDEYAEHVHAGEAWCGGHRAWEARSAFYACSARALGVGHECKVLHDARQRARLATLRRPR